MEEHLNEEQRLDFLLVQAEGLPDGETKIQLLEEAIQIADRIQNNDAGFYARLELTTAAIYSGRAEKAFLSFAWCLAQYDKDPSYCDEYNLMWQYKWIANQVDQFPQLSLDKIEQTLEDLKQRFTYSGFNLRPYYQLKHFVAWRRGDITEAKMYLEKWMDTPRDDMADCHACERNEQAIFYLSLGNLEEAYRIAQPIFNQELSCAEVPHITYGQFLLPLCKEGRMEEAAEFHQKGYGMIRQKKGFLKTLAEHIKYLTIIDLHKAASLLEHHLPEALASYEPNSKYHFYLASLILFDYMSDSDISVLNIPKYVNREWIDQQLFEIAKQFDQRNQNDYYQQKVIQERQWIEDLKVKIG
ncbi:hypothetical protein [Hazenella coriacea]|uniref:Tetratricopeptide repeat protein n=1 Tax=Hazenella coriacea TaxID=1179467 RepID=A0A4R3L292_9BACL|nr:hypothetical protein [Hazenella coriacea]TCS93663.1 hypothetical protein EDD58_10696 [Hazenella coriacea]